MNTKTSNDLTEAVSPDLGPAYIALREALAGVQAALGGGDFASRVVSRNAVRVFGYRFGHSSRVHRPFSAPLFCSPQALTKAAQDVRSIFRLCEEPVTHRGRVVARSSAPAVTLGSPGDLVLRGASLYFETASAAVRLATAWPPEDRHDGGQSEKWVVALFDEAEDFIDSFGGTAPAASRLSTKSRPAAIKSLIRIAKDNLGVDLAAVK